MRVGRKFSQAKFYILLFSCVELGRVHRSIELLLLSVVWNVDDEESANVCVQGCIGGGAATSM